MYFHIIDQTAFFMDNIAVRWIHAFGPKLRWLVKTNWQNWPKRAKFLSLLIEILQWSLSSFFSS